MSVAGTEDTALMEPIESTLRRLIWRARAAILARGVLATLAAASLAVLVGMGVAVKWPVFEAWQHYCLTFFWVLAAAATAVVLLIRPLARSFTLAGIARVIEQRHPELHERISSSVELLTSGDSPEVRGSEALIRALAAEACRDVRGVQPRREITFRKARPFLIAFAAAAGVIAALCLASAGMRKEFARRLLPFLNLPNLYASDLQISPGADRVLAEGERLEVKVAIDRVRVSSAEFRVDRGDGTDEVVEMSRLPDGTFAHTTGPLTRSMRYRIRGGDAVSRYFRATVVARPAVERVEAGYQYPDYLSRAEMPLAECPGRLRGPVGALATVRLHLNKPVADARLFVNQAPVELQRLDSVTYGFTHRLAEPGAGTWRVVLLDRHGYTGEASGEIIALADAAPLARIVRPVDDTLKLKPADRLPIFYTVGDDVGLTRAELLVSVDGRQREAVEIPTEPPAPAEGAQPRPGPTAAETMLNLAALDLESARRVTVQVRAWDNRPEELGGAQEGLSAVKTIELDVKAPSYVFQVQLALDLRIRETLERIHKELIAAKAVSEPLRRSMPSTKMLSDKTIRKIDEMRRHLIAAESDARALAEATSGSTYPKLSETLVKLADRHVAKARESAELVKITDAQKQRAELADEADFQVDRAIAIVSDLLKQFDVLTELARRALALEELARRQEELAAAGVELTTQPSEQAGEAMTPQEWEQAQDELAGDVGQVVRQTPQALREALEGDQQRTRNLAEMAAGLQRQQQALLAHTAASERIEQMRRDVAALAAEQAELARQAQHLSQQARPVERGVGSHRRAGPGRLAASRGRPTGGGGRAHGRPGGRAGRTLRNGPAAPSGRTDGRAGCRPADGSGPAASRAGPRAIGGAGPPAGGPGRAGPPVGGPRQPARGCASIPGDGPGCREPSAGQSRPGRGAGPAGRRAGGAACRRNGSARPGR